MQLQDGFEIRRPDPLRALRLDGRVAVVTGASSGLGVRFAQVLHAAGASVVGAARRTDLLCAVMDDLGDRALGIACDITKAADREHLIATTVEKFGSLDILVNNAGVSHAGNSAEHEELDGFRAVIDLNLTSVFALTQLAARSMLERQGGSVVNISSILGVVASPFKDPSYCASKAGLMGLTRDLALQWARRGIRVNSIAPGWFRTEMTEDGIFSDEGTLKYIRRNTPMGRGGDLHELDGALLFLCSDASSFVTGQTLTVDGGWTVR